eukprot:1909461-Rhodomonas_salina.4
MLLPGCEPCSVSLPSGQLRYQPTRVLCYAGTELVYGAISLRACYAMCITELVYGISLRACYAMCITELVYGAISLRACYAMSGSELAHGAFRWAVLSFERKRVPFPFSFAVFGDEASIYGGDALFVAPSLPFAMRTAPFSDDNAASYGPYATIYQRSTAVSGRAVLSATTLRTQRQKAAFPGTGSIARALSHCSELRELDLSSNRIGVEGAGVLRKRYAMSGTDVAYGAVSTAHGIAHPRTARIPHA